MKKFIFIFLFTIVFLFSFTIYHYFRFSDDKLHLVFCNVGQGDGIFIKTPGGSTILIDGGPDNEILSCLNNHMPFWKRDIDLVILTHPHADHLQGLLYIFDRYKVRSFATEDLKNNTFGYKTLLQKVEEAGLETKYLEAGNKITIGSVSLSIIGPTKSFLEKTSPNGLIGESKEFASVETVISFGNFRALLTGDSQAEELLDSLGEFANFPVSLLQIPHHGSATGLSREVLAMLKPKLGVISVGKKNPYHHPNPFTISLLKAFGISIKRTDVNGEVEVVSEGK